jgi:predicted RNase H-like HicB family nuclease
MKLGSLTYNSRVKIDVRLYQDEDGIWIAEVPSIPGCGSDGKTREEALINVRDAIDACLAVRNDMGMPAVVETVTIEIAAA